MKNKLNKNNIKSIIIFIIVLIIYNAVFWSIPFKHDGTFIGAYIFGTVAILAQIAVLWFAANGATTLKKKIYAFPIVRMGVIYLVVQLILSLVFSVLTTFVENMPVWIVCVISVIVLGVFTILILLTDTTRDEIIEIEEEEERQTAQVKTFRINIDSILRRVEDKELLKKLEKLSDIAKYSDPVSSEALFDIEAEITDKIAQLQTCVRNGAVEEAKALTDETIILFEDRNALCKNSKR